MRVFIRQWLIAVALLSATACASSRSIDKSFADLSTNAELKSVLFSDRSFDYGDIDITVYEGRLLLTGTIHSEDGRKKLIENAWTAEGVNQIIDEIFVGDGTSFGQGFEDARIDQTLRARLITAGGVNSGDYKIAVSRAVVYLLGSARSQEELDNAIGLARSVSGVEKVISYVDVRDGRGA